MYKSFQKILRNVVLLCTLLFIPELLAQIDHQPEFFGIFIDSPKELVELTEPTKAQLSSNKDAITYNLQGKWKTQRIWLSGNPAIILYGDEYAPSEVGLYKCTSIIPEFATAGNFTFTEIKLKVGPLAGLPAKAYKLIASEKLEEADYFLRYGNDYFPILLSKIRGSNPIKDEMYDIIETRDGSIVLASNNGLYIKKNGEWSFKELRGSKFRRLFNRYDKACSFFFIDENRKNGVGYSEDCGETFGYLTYEDLLKEEQYYNKIGLTITGIVNCPKNSNAYYIYGKYNDYERPEREIGFVITRDDTQDLLEFDGWSNRPVEWLVVHPEECRVAFLGGKSMQKYYTIDFGADWNKTTDFIENEIENVITAGIGPTDKDDFFQTRDGVYIYNEDQKKYEKSNWQYSIIKSYFWDDISLFAASELGLYESRDGGLNWEKRSNGIEDQNILGVININNNSDIIYALTTEQLYISADRGKTWTIE